MVRDTTLIRKLTLPISLQVRDLLSDTLAR